MESADTAHTIAGLIREYENRPGKDDLILACQDLLLHCLYAAAAKGDEGARAFVKEHDLKFAFGPQVDIDTVRIVEE